MLKQQLVTHFAVGPPPVLYISGEIDMATVQQLRDVLEKARSAAPAFALDMSGVTFIDASGMRVLVSVANARNGDGPLTIVNAPRVVSWLLELMGVNHTASIELRQRDDGHGG